MKSSVENKSVEIIGKNCKHNRMYCLFTGKLCGQNTTCDCFDGKGKLMFERRETHEKI